MAATLPLPSAAAFDVGAATHVGKVRQVNEDGYFVSSQVGVFAVADGMGGHEGGALASSALVEALATIDSPASPNELRRTLEDRVRRTNEALLAIAQERRAVLGSTIVALLVFGRDYACLWAGDSRLYLIRDDAIALLTRDHTEVRDLQDRGLITAEEARTWPRRHVITRAIGVAPQPELDLEHGMLAPGDAFVLCSDGLTGHVGDDDILEAVRGNGAQAACDALIALTLARGASDNVTVVVVRPPLPSASGVERLPGGAGGRLDTVVLGPGKGSA